MSTTADTITDRQIRALREEALAAGDYHQVDLCQRALVRDTIDTIDQDGNPIALADVTQERARAECAKVIADAEAQS